MKKIIDTIHHFLAPKESNNFRSRLLHHDFLSIYLVFALMLTFGISHIQNNSGSILGYATDITITKLVELTNSERAKNNLGILNYNDKLAEAADKKARDMFAKGYWSHYGPSGETPWEFILGADYQYEYAGENLAKNFLFSNGVVKAWMDSPTHKENILRPEYSDVGFAIVNGVLNGEETTLVVQMFGKPLYAPVNSQKETSPQTEKAPVVEQKTPVENSAPKVLSDNNRFQFYPTFLNMNLVFLSILLLALGLDFYFASKLNLIHLRGKNLVHILFVGFIIIGTFFIINGAIG